MKKFTAILLAVTLFAALAGCAQPADPPGVDPPPPSGGEEISAAQLQVNDALAELSREEYTYAQLTGTDALGRSVQPLAGTENKYVGIFYFVCLGADNHNAIYDVTQLLEEYGSETEGNPLFALPGSDAYDESVSPYATFHYWGEPLYGYYRSDDEWVIRRHMELFMLAGIDFLYLDYSNSSYEYPTALQAILNVILELQAEGYENVPLVTFMLPDSEADSAAKVRSLYDNWYSDSRYRTCWFRADRSLNPSYRPMVVGHFSSVTDETLREELWLKEMQWPSDAADENSFPWIEWNEAGTSQPNHGGIMNVSVAQHVRSWSSTSYTDSLQGGHSYAYRARGWTPEEPGEYGTEESNVLAGTNFAFQWQNALAAKDDLNMVTVTGWNEWAAIKVNYPSYPDYGVFNDLFNCTFSRDIEMMKGGYGDNYYMQLVENIRAFKGITVAGSDNVALHPQASAGSAAEASALPAVFCDIGADAAVRTSRSVGGVYDYRDESARNNIVTVSVGNDEEYLYVAATCEEPVSAQDAGGAGWMNVWLSSAGGGWDGYNFVVGRTRSETEASVEAFGESGALSAAGSAAYEVAGDTVLYKIPLSLLNVSARTVIGVKVTDNLQNFGSADDFYVSGDSAPLGRLNYAYKIA